LSIRSYFSAPLQQRYLLWQFARRDVLARYRGSLLGLGWSLLTPLLMLGVYTFVFRTVFRARWPEGDDGGLAFALQVYAGLIVFNLFAEMANRAPRLVLEQPNLVKKVVFPLEILPWVTLLAGLFHLAVNVAVLLVAIFFAQGALPASLIALPLVILAFAPFLLGMTWLLAALGVYLRDISQMMAMLTSLLMFLSPVFYPASALPERWQPLLTVNPLTLPIEQLRRVALSGQWPDWGSLAVYALIACLCAWLGATGFRLTRKGFADVL
jgi:lipopolysaccharide transport system permease protein